MARREPDKSSKWLIQHHGDAMLRLAGLPRQAPIQQKEQLHVVSQVLASIRYNDEQLIRVLGGKEGMTEFPLIQKFIKEAEQTTKHADILRILKTRFGEIPDDVPPRIRRFKSEKKLNSLLDYAVECKELEDFQSRLRS